VIRVYDAAGNVIETHEHADERGEFLSLLSDRLKFIDGRSDIRQVDFDATPLAARAF